MKNNPIKSEQFTFERVISNDSLPVILPIEIICGDCAGDGQSPIKTYQTADARCAGCGGRSFIPASIIEVIPAEQI